MDYLESRLPARLLQWAPQFYMLRSCFGLDPLLMAAICDRESKGGLALDPVGAAGVGDGGHGKGLFQIDDRSHLQFTSARFDDLSPFWAQPTLNAAYAGRLFSVNLTHCGGDTLTAIAAYNCGLSKAIKTARGTHVYQDKISALDAVTTNNYVSGVLSIYKSFRPIQGEIQ